MEKPPPYDSQPPQPGFNTQSYAAPVGAPPSNYPNYQNPYPQQPYNMQPGGYYPQQPQYGQNPYGGQQPYYGNQGYPPPPIIVREERKSGMKDCWLWALCASCLCCCLCNDC